MLRSRFECIISQIGAYIPFLLSGGSRELCRYGGSAIGPRRMCGERRAQGGDRAEFPTAQVGAERSEKGGRPRHAPETETKMRNFPRFSTREILYIRAFRFALSRFSTTFAVRFISPFMRMSYKRRPSRALPRPEKTTPAIYPTSSSTI